jgi:hypothetical protein
VNFRKNSDGNPCNEIPAQQGELLERKNKGIELAESIGVKALWN